MSRKLENRVVLLTGASGGVGKALALGLAEAGAAMALTDMKEEGMLLSRDAIESSGGQAACFQADLSQLDAIPQLVNAVIQHYNRIDVLINCAATNRRAPIDAVTIEDYEAILNLNLRAPYFLSKQVKGHMSAQGGGKIIHIGSINAGRALVGISVYAIAKAGLVQMTKNMALEWADENIQVNAICPGFLDTELARPLWEDPEKQAWITSRVPQRRLGKPEELVELTVYLASPGSDFLTGQPIYIDGGFTIGNKW